ncbi:MAG: hypothetical protein DRQ59_03270 [Gammaproteobacteria bacterium]|nr:MAG: hypothetical protein DRQ59_03270 [Gammaproteobacteria bacterium]
MSSKITKELESCDQTGDWFYPEWAVNAKYNKPFYVRDTDSALGRYNIQTKAISLKDLALLHGHLCDGLVIAYVAIRTVFNRLFPDGVVDRTDLRVVSKNGPCWIDAAALMTGARINFKSLRVDASMGEGFILQKCSTGVAYRVRLKAAVFPEDQAELENEIRAARRAGKPVSAVKIDRIEAMHDALSLKMLTTDPDQLFDIEQLENYTFNFNDLYGERGDVINKDMPR